MTNEQPSVARETYEAYRRGEITAAQAAKLAAEWYAQNRDSLAKLPKKD